LLTTGVHSRKRMITNSRPMFKSMRKDCANSFVRLRMAIVEHDRSVTDGIRKSVGEKSSS